MVQLHSSLESHNAAVKVAVRSEISSEVLICFLACLQSSPHSTELLNDLMVILVLTSR